MGRKTGKKNSDVSLCVCLCVCVCVCVPADQARPQVCIKARRGREYPKRRCRGEEWVNEWKGVSERQECEARRGGLDIRRGALL